MPAGATTATPEIARFRRPISIHWPTAACRWNDSSCAPCVRPTRAEFLTGRYHPRGGVRGVSTGQERLDLDEATVAEAFHAAGYATGVFGKWHNGSQWPYHPLARGFDEFFGYTSGHWGEYFDAPLEENGRMIRTEGYIVDVCTNRALDFIERNQNRPFFCYVPFTTPHSPWAVPDEYWAAIQKQADRSASRGANKEALDETRCVLAMVENQDWNVGRVLSKLDELALGENTIVLYFSDNGPNSTRWNGGMHGIKGSTDEGGVRSVCYIRWPRRLPAGHTVEQIAGAIDLLPTLTALAGIPRVGDKPLDGRDLSPLLLNQETDWPERMIFTTWAGRVSVRSQRHRLDDRGRLFDIAADPGQTTPLNRREPEAAARLIDAAQTWRAEMFDLAPDAVADIRGPAAAVWIPPAIASIRVPFRLGIASSLSPCFRPATANHEAMSGEARAPQLLVLRQLDVQCRQHGVEARGTHLRPL